MRRDRGSATVWAALVLSAVVVLTTVVLGYGAVLIGRHRAESAADLAALAAAGHVPEGMACAVASTVAVRNGGSLGECRVAGTDVEVSVSREVRLGRLGLRTVTARARAGPVDPAGP